MQFHLGRMKNGELPLRIQARFRRNQLEDIEPVEGPAVPPSGQLKLAPVSDKVM